MFFFLIIDLYFLTPAVIAQIFNSTPELVILIGIPRKEGKAETEIHFYYRRKFCLIILLK